jgi:hypothetical protein
LVLGLKLMFVTRREAAEFKGRKSPFRPPRLVTQQGKIDLSARATHWLQHWPRIATSTIGFQEPKPLKPISEFRKMYCFSSTPEAEVGGLGGSKIAHKSICDNLLTP